MKFDSTKTVALHIEESELVEENNSIHGGHLSSHSKSRNEVPNEAIMSGSNELKLYANPGPAILDSTVITSHSTFRLDVDAYTYLNKHCSAKSKSEDNITFENSNNKDLNSSDYPTNTSPTCFKTNDKSPIHSKSSPSSKLDNPELIESRLSQYSASKATNIDLNKTATVYKTEHRQASNQNLTKADASIGHAIAFECKGPNESTKNDNQHQKLSDEQKNKDTKSNPIYLVHNDQESSKTKLPKEEEPKNIQRNILEIPRICELTAYTSPNIYEKKDSLNPKHRIPHQTSNVNSVVSTDPSEKISEESDAEQCCQSVTSTSTSPSTTTIVQLEISKTAELSTAKLQKTNISNYIKPEQRYSTNTSSQKDSKLRRRRVFKSDNVETSRTSTATSKKIGSTSDCVIEINRESERLETNNFQLRDCSTKAQSNRDALQLQTGSRNWKKRLRRAFPTSVLTNECFVSANARLYLPRSSDSGVLDTNMLSSISHILHLYENDAVNDNKMDLEAPNMPEFVDASTEIQLTTSDNANFIIPNNKSLSISKFKQTNSRTFEKLPGTNTSIRISKEDYGKNEQSTSKAAVLDTSSHSINNAPEPSNTNNINQRGHGKQTSSITDDLHGEAISTSTSATDDIPRIRKFNKAKHIQLYTPLIAKLISLDIAAILANYIYNKLSTTLESFSTPFVAETPSTNTITTTRDIGTHSSQAHTDILATSSSKPINNSQSLRRRCSCKRNHQRKYETVEISLKSEVIEIILGSDIDEPYKGYQVEYVELELESGDETG
jgi:hypothetical protein